jgi:apolipoprotein N-acyltransferase
MHPNPTNFIFRLLSSLLTAILLTLALPPHSQSWLVWIALAPWLLALKATSSRREILILSFTFALPYHLATLWWISHVTAIGTFALCLYLSLYPVTFAFLFHSTLRKIETYTSWRVLYAATIGATTWTTLEWLRSWLLTGFIWNHLATTQYLNIPFIQITAITGIYGPIALIAMANITLALTIPRFIAEARREQPLRPHLDFSITFALVALAFAFGLRHLFTQSEPANTRPLTLASIQANIPQEIKASREFTAEEIFEKHLRLTHLALPIQPDLILWPETSTGYSLLELLYARQPIFSIAEKSDFLFGVLERHFPDTIYNSACLIPKGSTSIQQAQIYQKNHLVIFGEYTPLAHILPFLRNLVPYPQDLKAGKEIKMLKAQEGTLRLAPLICFEDVVPSLVRRYAPMQPHLLINLTNDGWFKDSPGALQHLANSIFRAIELRTPMIRATNTGITAIITPTGAISHKLTDANGREVNIEGVLTAKIQLSEPSPLTFYARHGDYFAYLCLLIALLPHLNFRKRGLVVKEHCS